MGGSVSACVMSMCVHFPLSASPLRSNLFPSFILPFFCFNSSLPRHLILWSCRHVRGDGAFLPPRLLSFELSSFTLHEKESARLSLSVPGWIMPIHLYQWPFCRFLCQTEQFSKPFMYAAVVLIRAFLFWGKSRS